MKGVRDALCLVMTALRKLPVVEGCDAVPRGQEGGGPEAVQGAAAGLLCGLRSRPHHLALKVTKAFLSKKKKDPEENEEKGKKGNLEGR